MRNPFRGHRLSGRLTRDLKRYIRAVYEPNDSAPGSPEPGSPKPDGPIFEDLADVSYEGYGSDELADATFEALGPDELVDEEALPEELHAYGTARRSPKAHRRHAVYGGMPVGAAQPRAAARPHSAAPAAPAAPKSQRDARRVFLDEELRNRVEHLDLSFSEMVLHLIDGGGERDSDVYRRARVSRQVFSKLRSDSGYRPSKRTAMALAVALGLDVQETEDLLARAGYALSRSSLFDVIVRFFIERDIHDVFTINEALYAYDQELLG